MSIQKFLFHPLSLKAKKWVTNSLVVDWGGSDRVSECMHQVVDVFRGCIELVRSSWTLFSVHPAALRAPDGVLLTSTTSQQRQLPMAGHEHENSPHPHLSQPSTSHLKIGANHHHPQLLHTPRMCSISEDSTLAIILAQETLCKVELATKTTTKTTMTMMMGAGTVMLCGGAMGTSRGGMLDKESMERACWKAEDVKKEGGMEIETPTTNNDDDDQAFLGVKGGLESATIVPKTIPVQPLPCPPLPALPKSNIWLPRALQLPQLP
ncbi:hypothetical protein EDD85DRAFT_792782 [Armillaria nabsnona]|nr:hypothetical protein EDD85DRAFT_792782 [Armillaria nabsnona]